MRDDRFERVSIDRKDVSEPEPIIMSYSHSKIPSYGGESGKGKQFGTVLSLKLNR